MSLTHLNEKPRPDMVPRKQTWPLARPDKMHDDVDDDIDGSTTLFNHTCSFP